ncbi:MAG: hypothetical protein ACRELY_29375, partial [Polyangiaceae bacterium]
MNANRFRILFWIVIAACFIGAGMSIRSHPRAAIAVLFFASLLLFVVWRSVRAGEAVAVAGLSGDVDALRRIVGGQPPESFSALVALAIFEGSACVEAMPHAFCQCEDPACQIHFLNDQMTTLLALLRDSEDGRWRRRLDEVAALMHKFPRTGIFGHLRKQLDPLYA